MWQWERKAASVRVGKGIPSRVAVDVPTGFRTGLVLIAADRYDVIDKELVQHPLLCVIGGLA
jgi:hypothetical protein